MADQQEGFRPWVFQEYRQSSLVTTKVRRKTKTKPTCCTFLPAVAASLLHHSHLQAQGCLSFMPLLNVPSWPLLRAAFEGDRHNPPSLPCWWLCGAGGAGSWLLLPSLLEHRSSRAWQLRFQSHKSASHLGLKVQKTVEAVNLPAKESGFWSVGVGHGGRAEGDPAEPLPFQNGFAVVPGLSRENLTLGESDKCFGGAQRMATCMTSSISSLMCLQWCFSGGASAGCWGFIKRLL